MPAPVAAVAPAPAAPANAPSKAPVVAVKPTVPTPTSAAAPASEALHELTVGGEKKKLPIGEIIKLAQKADYAGGLSRQAKEVLKAYNAEKAEREARESIWDDDEKLEAELLKRGKLDTIARKRLEAKIREQEMSPEQKQLADRDAENADLKKKLQAVEDEKAQQRISAHAEKLRQHANDLLGDAAQRAGLPERDPDSFDAIAHAVTEFRDLGLLPKRIEDWTPGLADRICEAAKEKIESTFKGLEGAVLRGLKGKALYDRLGRQVVDELNRYQVELIRGGGQKKAPAATPVAPASAPSEYLTVEQAREMMRKAAK